MVRPVWLDDIIATLAPFVPPAFGAFIGLKWTKEQTPAQRVLSAVGGFGLGVWVGPAIAEFFSIDPAKQPNMIVAVGIFTAMLGMDIIGLVMVMIDKLRVDPFGTMKAWLELIPWPTRRS